MGSITERSDGRWMVRVTDPTSGKRRTAYASTHAEAVWKRRSMLAKAERRESVLDSAATLRTWADDWTASGRAARRRRDSTVGAYVYRLDTYVLPAIGGVRLRDLTPLHIDDLSHSLAAKGLSAATIKGSLIALSACLDDAVRGRLLTANPARGVTVPSRRRARPKSFPRPPSRSGHCWPSSRGPTSNDSSHSSWGPDVGSAKPSPCDGPT